jgi:hypothetical protein
VTEEGLGLGIPGARAELASGSPFTIANTTGQFRLYGLPPAADIRISANGYETRTFSLQLSGNVSRSFALPLTGGRPPVAGAYTLFVDAISCPSSSVPALSAGLQHRVYNAVLTQSGTQIAVKLGGAQFQTNSMNLGDSFTGSVIHGGVRFFLDFYIQYYFYDPTAVFYPAVAERLPDGTFLVTQGSINMTGAPDSGFSGAFSSGGMFLWDSKFPDRASRLIAGCSGQITLKLVPR